MPGPPKRYNYLLGGGATTPQAIQLHPRGEGGGVWVSLDVRPTLRASCHSPRETTACSGFGKAKSFAEKGVLPLHSTSTWGNSILLTSKPHDEEETTAPETRSLGGTYGLLLPGSVRSQARTSPSPSRTALRCSTVGPSITAQISS